MERSAWIETDLTAIVHNVSEIKRWIGPDTEVLAVVKANAYGHGLVEVAIASIEAGARMLGVAFASEAVALRHAGIVAPILVLGCALPEESTALVALGISQAVSNAEIVEALSSAAVAQRKRARVHAKIDTGMGRVGVACERAVPFVEGLLRRPGIELEGIMTHFATADQPEDLSFAYTQLHRFQAVVEKLHRKGIDTKWRHAANSAAIVFMHESFLDMVRTGLLLYGIPPTDGDPPGLELRSALSLKAKMTQLRTVRPGESVSYGRTFVPQRRSRLGIVPVGYADGYSRGHSNRGEVIVKGQRVPIVGRVCMDQFVVDVTELEGLRLGEPVVLIGQQGQERITAWDVALSMGSIPHEVLSALGDRLPRVFLR